MFEIKRRNGDTYTVLVDPEDLPRVLAAGPWCMHDVPHNRTLYVKKTVRENGRQRTEYLHRFLVGVPGVAVDHVNCNGLDNRKENLRASTSAQNQGNVYTKRNNTSGYKGVTWHKAGGRWCAQIQVLGRNRHLGLYNTPEEAHAAYVQAAADVFGEFRRTR